MKCNNCVSFSKYLHIFHSQYIWAQYVYLYETPSSEHSMLLEQEDESYHREDALPLNCLSISQYKPSSFCIMDMTQCSKQAICVITVRNNF